MTLDTAKGVFADNLPSFVIPGVFSDVVIIDVCCILVFASMNNTVGKFSTLAF